MIEFHTKSCELGTWMARILCLGTEVSMAATRRGISMNDFIVESKIYLNIIWNGFLPCTHLTVVTNMQAQMVACILSSISLNMGEIMILDWRYLKSKGGILLSFPSLITKLCRRVRVEKYLSNTWVKPNPRITPLKIYGEGEPGQRKMRKVKLCKSTTEKFE